MLKSGLISLFVLLLLIIVAHLGLFELLASTQALWLGIGTVVFMLIIAFLVLGNPIKK